MIWFVVVPGPVGPRRPQEGPRIAPGDLPRASGAPWAQTNKPKHPYSLQVGKPAGSPRKTTKNNENRQKLRDRAPPEGDLHQSPHSNNTGRTPGWSPTPGGGGCRPPDLPQRVRGAAAPQPGGRGGRSPPPQGTLTEWLSVICLLYPLRRLRTWISTSSKCKIT